MVLYCFVLGGLKSMGLTRPHLVGMEKGPPVGTPTIRGLSMLGDTQSFRSPIETSGRPCIWGFSYIQNDNQQLSTLQEGTLSKVQISYTPPKRRTAIRHKMTPLIALLKSISLRDRAGQYVQRTSSSIPWYWYVRRYTTTGLDSSIIPHHQNAIE